MFARGVAAGAAAARWAAIAALASGGCAVTRPQAPAALAPPLSTPTPAAAVSGTQAAPSEHCPIAGEMAHWQADYCMAQVGTDDIIAAGPCLARETAIDFRSACSAKRHYKTRMCELALANGVRTDSVEACVADPRFVGFTVRNGGA